MVKHTGEAENRRLGGPDESGVSRQNAPFRQLHEGGHALNHGYKVPAAKISLDLAENASYMHPLDHGSGPKPEVPPKVWGKANAVKPMSQQGTGKAGPPRIT
jgi:hypothetical protein